MLEKLRNRLAALQKSLGIQEGLREFHRRRMLARHKEQVEHETVLVRLEDEADELWKRARSQRRAGHIARAEEARKKALRKDAAIQKRRVRAERAKAKSIVWKQRARNKTRLIQEITEDIEQIQREIAELGPVVHLDENKITGGTFGERWRTANLTAVTCCNNGRRRNAYSQGGSPDIWHPFGPGPAIGRRDDCSSYNTSICLATGAEDPNGRDYDGQGFTGTQAYPPRASGWKQVSLAVMMAAGHGYIIYGPSMGHHVELYCPSPTDRYRTVGHGSAPVDFGTIHLFGPNEVERYYIYDPA